MLNTIINNGQFDQIDGWCTKEKALYLESLIKPEYNCIELGVFGGKSFLPICLTATSGTVYGIDPWRAYDSLAGKNDKSNDDWWSKIDYEHFYQKTLQLMKTFNCHNSRIIRENSLSAHKYFGDSTIDFLHQDSNHSEDISCSEITLYASKVKSNGIWVMDDTNWPTTQAAQQLILRHGFVEIYDSTTWKVFRKV